MLDHVLTVQVAHGQILVDVLNEIRRLRAELAQFRQSSLPPPFNDGFWLPFGIPSQKWGVHIRVLFSGGDFFFFFWSLEPVEIRLYLGASLCIYFFWLLMYSCWDYHFRGSYIYCFICFLFHFLLTFIHDVFHWYLSLFCVMWNQKLILFTCIFHTCVYAFCLVFQEKYKLIQLSYCLHLQLMDSS